MKKYHPAKQGITQSILTNFMRCPQMGVFSVGDGEQHWESVGLAERVRFGNICHDILEGVYSPGAAPTEELVEVLLERAADKLANEGDTSQEAESDLARAEAIMKEYIYTFPDDFHGKAFKGSETVFEVEWMGYPLKGKIDANYKDKKKKLWIMDHKTKGKIVENKIVETLARDFQLQFYQLIYEVKIQPTAGVMLNVIRNSGHKPHKGESLPDFIERLRDIVRADPQGFFYRFPVIFTPKDQEEFRGELIWKLGQVDKIMSGRVPVMHNETQCQMCDYVRLCNTGSTNGYKRKALFSELGG